MRPKIICHMITSIDGRLLTDRFEPPAGVTDYNAFLWARYEEAEARLPHDGWIAGRKTLERYAVSLTDHALEAPTERQDVIGDRHGQKLGVLFDPSGRLFFEKNTMEDHLVFVFSTQVPQAHVDHVQSIGASGLFAGPDGRDIASVLDRLGDHFGARTLLLEGGARLNGAFLAQRLIDETSTLVMPAIDGLAGMPSIYEHSASENDPPAQGQAMELISAETLEGGVVWLRHRLLSQAANPPSKA
ncbi:dihydrofolate reductase family protein [Paracoccus albus]|uniref:dihydrofolate reductase family protein n=1 Tax=Paracoccus albus TaxID=3017784 RepID=UPI0022F04690|nr:dihydrofolate reductase family protein [Paracoccus albus]WBU60568.1 dihydrofolate reductase family protein [Paracoccus albus]